MNSKNEIPGFAAKHTTGNTSMYTGNSVLHRTVINTPENEPKLRGTLEGLEAFRSHNLAMVPLGILKSVLEDQGVEFVDETGAVV